MKRNQWNRIKYKRLIEHFTGWKIPLWEKYYLKILPRNRSLSTSQLSIPLLINYLLSHIRFTFSSVNLLLDDSRVFRRVWQLIGSVPRTKVTKMLWKYWRFPADSRLPSTVFNENPFAAGSAPGLCPEYSNSVRGYQRNCHGCYWQNPISDVYRCKKTRIIGDTLFRRIFIIRPCITVHVDRQDRGEHYGSNNMLIIGLVTINIARTSNWLTLWMYLPSWNSIRAIRHVFMKYTPAFRGLR